MGVHSLIFSLHRTKWWQTPDYNIYGRQILNRRPMQAAAGTNPQGNGAIYFALNHAVLSWTPQPLTILLKGSHKGEGRALPIFGTKKTSVFFLNRAIKVCINYS